MKTPGVWQWRLATPFVLLLTAGLLAKPARAQDILSGHTGVAFPLVTYTSATSGSTTTTINDSFNIVFPFGIGVKPPGSPVLLDFEFVPEVHPSNRNVTLLVHPGVIKPLPKHWAIGLRAAFAYYKARWFVEGDLPVRFSQQAPGNNATSVGFNIFGVGF